MANISLREWLEAAEQRGELLRINGAHWDLEMSSIAELIFREGKEPLPAILYDQIPDYPEGYRTLFGLLTSSWGIAKTLGLPEDQTDRMSLLQNWYQKSKTCHPLKPKLVTTGPVLANSDTGDQVDLFKFPIPRFHELDGGRYVGTCHAIIQKDPDSGYVNLGGYRSMTVDRNHVALHINPSKDGNIILYQKYWARKKAMPVVIAIGMDPILWWFSCQADAPWGVSEYDYAGGVTGEPIEVIEGPHTGILLPARAEILIEGECRPDAFVDEGPFGEWHGYYSNAGLTPVSEPIVEVKAVHYRDNPILTCSQMAVPPHSSSLIMALTSSVAIWNRLEAYGIPGIKAVWAHEIASGILLRVISIEQLYAGHARQIGLLASQYGGNGSYTIVVEEDIDPSSLEQVMWSVVTRALPDRSIHIIPDCRAMNSNPAIPLPEKAGGRKPLTAARVVIDGCRSLTWKKDWYPMAKVSPELRTKILAKWQTTLSGLLGK
ncbi:UbiD family decarboxylase [Chloroflexota bacterium]